MLNLVLLEEPGKNMSSVWNRLLAQMIKIPKSTSIAHVLILVELLVICVWNFFFVCMSLNLTVVQVWEILDQSNYIFELMLDK